MIGRLRHLDHAEDVGHSLALGDQLRGGYRLADDLLGLVPGVLHYGVPGLIWPAEISHSHWSDSQSPRHGNGGLNPKEAGATVCVNLRSVALAPVGNMHDDLLAASRWVTGVAG